jgi:hypothetical protein
MDNITQIDKNALVEAALYDPTARVALAASMANPVRMDLDYQAIGRKCVIVDPIPQGELVIYDRDIRVPAKVVGRRGRVQDAVLEGERVTVPTFQVASYPQVSYSEIQYRKYNIVDRAQQRAKLDLMATEDTFIFSAFENSSAALNTVSTVTGAVTKDVLLNAIREVGKWPLNPEKLVMNPLNYYDLLRFGRNDIDPVTQREILQTGLWGHIFTCDILVSNLVPVNRIYVIASPEQTGVMPIRQDVTVTPADIPAQLKLGWVIYETIGIGILNARAVSRIEVTGKTAYTPWFLSNTIGEPIYTNVGSL